MKWIYYKMIVKFNLIELLIYIYFNLIKSVLSKNKEVHKIRELSLLNEIIIKTIGNKKQRILDNEFIDKPSEIIINNNSGYINENNEISNSLREENVIIMKWNYKVKSCTSMFKNLTNIVEIDLSNFDASEVDSMNQMFCSCTNLRRVIIGNNFNSSKVQDMGHTFYDCESLISLDLSHLDASSSKTFAYMFSNCISLTSINLSNFNTSSASVAIAMFLNCYSLESLDLSSFNTSKISYATHLFYNCYSLKSLDLSKFDTSNFISYQLMFAYCISLTSLDLSNFKTSKSSIMYGMFYGCSELQYLDISNFNTSLLINSDYMFYNCSKLISIEMPNFFGVNLLSSIEMFNNCSNLQYINLNNSMEATNINVSNIFNEVPDNIVYCISNEEKMSKIMEEINKKSCPIKDCSNNWRAIQKLIIQDNNICVDSCYYNNIYYYKYKSKCYSTCPEETHSLNDDDNICIIDCPEDLPFLNNDKCISNCTAMDFFSHICIISNENINSKEYIIKAIINEISSLKFNTTKGQDLLIKDRNITYQITSTNNQLNNEYKNITSINFGECENILKKEYNINTNESLIIYKIDYFLDDFFIPITEYMLFHPESLIKLDLNYCKDILINIYIPISINEESLYKHDPNSEYYKDKCNRNTSGCETNDTIIKKKNEFNHNFLSLCEANCNYKGYNNNTKKVLCDCKIKNHFSFLSELLNKTNELLYHFNLSDNENDYSLEGCNIQKFFENKCTFNNTLDFKQKIINMIKNQLIYGYLSELLNEYLFKKKEDLIKKESDITYQLTSSENQKNKEYTEISTIKLNDCENKLKKAYNISENESLIIFKIDNIIPELNIPIIEYEIYHPITNAQLDLNICKESPISLLYSVNINEDEIFKYDPNSDFYKDKCYPYTTPNGTDIILNDRKKEYNEKNLSLCEKDCTFIDYNKETKKATCECSPKTKLEELANIYINKDVLLNKFINFKSNTNFDVIFCFKTFFCVKGIKENIGSYILIIIIIVNIIGIILFYKIGKREIIQKIKSIFLVKKFKNKNFIIGNLNKKENKKYLYKIIKVKNKSNSNYKYNIKKENKKINNPPKRSSISASQDSKKSFNTYEETFKSINKFSKFDKSFKKEKSFLNIKEIKPKKEPEFMLKFTDKEMNSFQYEKALKYDKRTYLQYYISLIKNKHLFIFAFITINDYNSRIIKINLFFFCFALNYTINSFFFQDSKIHNIYINNGIYNFIYQIPQICYSTIISALITFLFRFLALSENSLIDLKNAKNSDNSYRIIKKLKIKHILFYVLLFIFLLLFWYYLGCFCAVFRNSQIHLIKDTLFSFLLSLIYPFGLQLLPGIFRIPALKSKNKKCLYQFSKFVQLI